MGVEGCFRATEASTQAPWGVATWNQGDVIRKGVADATPTSTLDVASTVAGLAALQINGAAPQTVAGHSVDRSALVWASSEQTPPPASPSTGGGDSSRGHRATLVHRYHSIDNPTVGLAPLTGAARFVEIVKLLHSTRLTASEFDPVAGCGTGTAFVTASVRVAGLEAPARFKLVQLFDTIGGAMCCQGPHRVVRRVGKLRGATVAPQRHAAVPQNEFVVTGCLHRVARQACSTKCSCVSVLRLYNLTTDPSEGVNLLAGQGGASSVPVEIAEVPEDALGSCVLSCFVATHTRDVIRHPHAAELGFLATGWLLLTERSMCAELG